MTLLEFMNHFPDEAACKEHFRKQREQEGIICKKCGCTKHYWLKDKWQWQCADCRFRTALRSGSVIEHSKLPLRKWYLAIAFMSFSKKGISAKEMQRQLGHSCYESIWSMMHRIRDGMGKRDDLYRLQGMIEMDEGYFEQNISRKTKLKRGKGSQQLKNVAVMAESTPLEDPATGKQTKQCRYFKMKVLQSHKEEFVNNAIKESVNFDSVIFSDCNLSYLGVEGLVDVHVTEESTPESTKSTFHWVHIAICNAKRFLVGIYHKVKGKYLQNYLNEFCYKLNRRTFGDRLFDRLTLAIAKTYW